MLYRTPLSFLYKRAVRIISRNVCNQSRALVNHAGNKLDEVGAGAQLFPRMLGAKDAAAADNGEGNSSPNFFNEFSGSLTARRSRDSALPAVRTFPFCEECMIFVKVAHNHACHPVGANYVNQ